MSLAGLMTRTATITRRAQTGVPGRTGLNAWVDAAPVEVSCYLELTAQAEMISGREAQIADALIVFPAGTALDGSDRVAVDGVTYEVIGPVNPSHSPAGEHHVEASLQVVEG